VSQRLKDKVIAITGAAQGIGAHFASVMAQQGAKVVLADIDHSRAEMVSRDINGAGGQSIAVAIDVANRESTRSALEQAVQKFGRLDVLFNNAGVSKSAGILDVTEADWHRIMDVNGLGVLIGIQEAAKIYIKQGGGGKIINTCSISSRQGYPMFSAYCASKAAVLSLTQSSARALAPHRITVTGFAPGVVDTPLWTVVAGADGREAKLRSTEANILLGRVSTPADLAGTGVFLASSDSDYITGQVIMVDGGMVLV
jgi:meso-butanediol dehydrogenase/(S,S)-butanediol dehydrogenase/diacetyl reductase